MAVNATDNTGPAEHDVGSEDAGEEIPLLAPSARLSTAVDVPETPSQVLRRRARRPAFAISPITLRILAVNVLALAILVVGLMYLGEYRRSLIETEIETLSTQGEVFAAALGESAVLGGTTGPPWLNPDTARALVRRLVQPTATRARLFTVSGEMIVDSRTLLGPGGLVQVEELPPPPSGGVIGNVIIDAYDWLAGLVEGGHEFPPYRERRVQRATDYSEVVKATGGETASAVRTNVRDVLVINVAVPVQQYKKVVGALLLSSATGEIEQTLRSLRLDILKVFGVVMAITVLMSLYLARAIARPITRLAAAAEQVRRGRGRKIEIPDFTARRDEIGELSGALRDMTDALWRRMDAIDRFAADVAHEIKNPLSSVRSAVETAVRVQDPERRAELMSIILEDVQRLDRLISDISYASRLDSQLSRDEWSEIEVTGLLAALVSVYEATIDSRALHIAKRLQLEPPLAGSLLVRGNEDQLVQVLRNIINNALSFTPKGSTIDLGARREGDQVVITIDDHGPGIPEENLKSIFARFYTARPPEEKFGTHSGLGLSISKQIVEGHGGTLHAENRVGEDGAVAGARFVMTLPGA